MITATKIKDLEPIDQRRKAYWFRINYKFDKMNEKIRKQNKDFFTNYKKRNNERTQT